MDMRVGDPVMATDPDGDGLSHLIIGSSVDDAFKLDPRNTQLRMARGVLDVEVHLVYLLEVQANDDRENSMTASSTFLVCSSM